MKKIFCLVLAGFCFASFSLKAAPQFSKTDIEASEIAKTMLQNEKYFNGLNETQKAAVCTGAIASFQTCLSGEEAGEQVLQTSKFLFAEVYGDLSAFEAYLTAGQLYGYLLSKATQKCDPISEFTNKNCQEMMLKNAQYIQEHFSKK